MSKIVEKMDNLGRGIIYDNGKVTFIPKTMPGDEITYEIVKSKKSYNEGKLLEIINPAKNRVDYPCPYYTKCGGCDLEHFKYEDTLVYKKKRIIDIFKRSNIDINPIVIANSSPYNYRNKITLKVIDGKIGYYEYSTHTIVQIDSCLLASDVINKAIKLLDNLDILNGEIVIRTNKNKELLIVINTKDKINIDIDYLKKYIKLVGVVINDKTIYGENFLYENINDIFYRISYDSFFQVNPYVASKLFEIVKNEIDNDDSVLDIYSGVGTLSLSAAKKASQVVGIEIVANAVLNAIFNASMNKIENVNFVLNDASVAVTKLNQRFNKIIVDPPRSGLSKSVLDVIIKMQPEKLIYVSCNADTLLRDIKLLDKVYEIETFYILDMFSYTYHCEAISILKLKK